jgi:hypothetical protein
MPQLARRTATVTVALFIAMGAAFAPSAEALTSAEKLTYLERELNDVSYFWFMYAKCATYSWWQRSTCRGTANSYYWAVRNFGAS